LKNTLIFGATGWLGKSTLRYLVEKNNDVNFTLVSSTQKNIEYKNEKFQVISFNEFLKLEGNNYDLFFNYAFLTGKKVNDYSSDRFNNETNLLIEGTQKFLEKNSVGKILMTSSGAIYNNGTNKESIYGLQKHKQEKKLLDTCKSLSTKVSIARIFALIADYYNYEYEYAFSSFINQAKKNKKIVIKSDYQVIRSYLFLDSLLEYFISSQTSETFDAWNVTLDIYDLAHVVSNIFNSKIEISDNYFSSEFVDNYSSEDTYFINKIKNNYEIENEVRKVITTTESKSNIIKVTS
jgi:nucleoside-diphosphate-sugar epimerase